MFSVKQLVWNGTGELAPLVCLVALAWGAWKLLKKSPDPVWVVAAIVAALAALVAVGLQAQLLSDDDPSNDLADVTYVSYAIVPLFVFALWRNGHEAFSLARELASEASGAEGTVRRRYRALLAGLSGAPGARHDAQELLVEELLARDELTPLVRRMLPTLGLVGTVVGLSMAMAQLGTALSAAVAGGGNADGLMQAMSAAMAGMGGAFVTTLLGAGYGLLLMVMGSRTESVTRRLVSVVAQKVEAPQAAPSATATRPPRKRFDANGERPREEEQ